MKSPGEDPEPASAAEREFKDWCKESGYDPLDPGAREAYQEEEKERAEETGDQFWQNLSADDRAGYEDNLNRD